MKIHLLGFCIALLTFFGSFYFSPILFFGIGIGHGATTDGSDWCNFYPHVSNHFVQLYATSCDYHTTEQAVNNINKKVTNAFEIVESIKEIEMKDGKKVQRAVIILQENDLRNFCIIKAHKNWVDDICSPSLRHIIEFERQKYPE